MRLVTIPISHYCEKARWTLDHCAIDYLVETHLPGPHAGAIKKLSEQSAVPVLCDGEKTIAGSDDLPFQDRMSH